MDIWIKWSNNPRIDSVVWPMSMLIAFDHMICTNVNSEYMWLSFEMSAPQPGKYSLYRTVIVLWNNQNANYSEEWQNYYAIFAILLSINGWTLRNLVVINDIIKDLVRIFFLPSISVCASSCSSMTFNYLVMMMRTLHENSMYDNNFSKTGEIS